MSKPHENIKKRRIDLGISQQELAELVGYKGKSMISQVESGNVDLPLSMLERFANALKCTPSHLMGWDESSDDSMETSQKYDITAFEYRIVIAYRAADSGRKESVCTLLNIEMLELKKGEYAG